MTTTFKEVSALTAGRDANTTHHDLSREESIHFPGELRPAGESRTSKAKLGKSSAKEIRLSAGAL
jgi:hypothetical protein